MLNFTRNSPQLKVFPNSLVETCLLLSSVNKDRKSVCFFWQLCQSGRQGTEQENARPTCRTDLTLFWQIPKQGGEHYWYLKIWPNIVAWYGVERLQKHCFFSVEPMEWCASNCCWEVLSARKLCNCTTWVTSCLQLFLEKHHFMQHFLFQSGYFCFCKKKRHRKQRAQSALAEEGGRAFI